MTTNISASPKNCNFKVVLLGEGCVGKTSLVLRYIEDKFNPQHNSTLQASFVTKKLLLDDGRRAQLNIWDTAGQERFHALGPIYYRSSHGAVLVYDITDLDSFQKVKNWVRELKRMLGAEITITIVGNKIDLEHQRMVKYDDAFTYAETVGAHHFETSAKINEGVTELFEQLTKLMVNQHAQREQDQSALRLAPTGRRPRTLLVDDTDASETHDDDANDNNERMSGGSGTGGGSSTHRSCCSS